MVLTPRPYQNQAIMQIVASASLADRPHGILVSPAGSGKTLISAWIMQRMARRQWLWVAPTQETVDQGRQACERVGLSDVTFCCYAAQPDAAGYDGIILDECHRAQCDTFRSLMATVRTDAFALGVTATPKRADGLDITEVIGPIWHTVPRSDVEAAGGVTSARVWWIDVPGDIHAQVQAEVAKRARNWWTDEQTNRETFRWAKKLGITENDWRNRKAAQMARRAIDKGRSCLVLVAEKKQGRRICELIGDGAVMAHSGMKDRAGVMDGARAGDVPCLVATQILDEGADLPIMSVLIMACGGRAEGRTEQRIGRIMRPMPGKPQAWCIEFKDEHHGMLKAQSKARERVYRAIGLEV